MRALAALLGIASVLVATTAPDPPYRGTLDDLRADAVYILNQCPGVARVEQTVRVREPKHRIIHVVDLHAVTPDELAADLRDQDTSATDAEIESA